MAAIASVSVEGDKSVEGYKSVLNYPIIYFMETGLSLKTIINITLTHTTIFDPTTCYNKIFSGGKSKYTITITIGGTKKNPHKNITIKKLLPLCPLSKEPFIEPDMIEKLRLGGHSEFLQSLPDGCNVVQGFAFNCYQVNFTEHRRFDLNPVLYIPYAKSEDRRASGIYLVAPILDGRKMHPDIIESLYKRLGNMDIVKIIAEHYFHQSVSDFNFYMDKTQLQPDTLYSRKSLVKLFKEGKLEIGITSGSKYHDTLGLDGSLNGIMILSHDSYNHVSPFGKKSYLKQIFTTCDQMIKFREMIIKELFNHKQDSHESLIHE